MQTLHLTFDVPSCGAVRGLLTTLDEPGDVLYLGDDFSVGPLGTDLGERAAWFWEVHGLDEDLVEHDTSVFDRVVAASDVTIWINRLNARERCGFSEIVRRRATSIRVIDIADRAAHRIGPLWVGTLGVELAMELGVYDSGYALDDRSRAAALAEWRRVTIEGAYLRLVQADRLVSVPVDYFDDYIASFIDDTWRISSTVIGQALGHSLDDGKVFDDHFACGRVRAMIDEGRLELSAPDEDWDMYSSKLRRSPGRTETEPRSRFPAKLCHTRGRP